jgi:hypothetical protein
MRLTGMLLVAAIALTGCGGGDDDGAAFTASGTVTLGGPGRVLFADGAGDGDECQGAGDLSGVDEDAEVVVTDADGSKVAVGHLEPGTLAEGSTEMMQLGIAFCEFEFSVEDIPGSDGLFTASLEGEDLTFKQSESEGLELDVIREFGE